VKHYPMSERALLLSIRPKYASKVFDGTKTVELRRVRPRIEPGDVALVYVSSPVKALLGAFEVARVEVASPVKLWSLVESKAGVTLAEYEAYFKGAKEAYAIFLERAWKLDRPLLLERLRRRRTGFRPPQSYHYLSASEVTRIGVESLLRCDLSDRNQKLLLGKDMAMRSIGSRGYRSGDGRSGTGVST